VTRIEVVAPEGVPEVRHGDDLVGLLLPLVDLADGDVVVVTSKVVSKAEGRVVTGNREDLLAGETQRVVARRGPTTIVRTRLVLTMAAAGIDASNVAAGSVVLLPEDPDGSARAVRTAIHARTGRNVGVVVTDTAGRAWREGQTDIAIGAAGLRVVLDFAGHVDPHGNELAVTLPAVADEIAGVAQLAAAKLGARPFAVVRGRADLGLPVGESGPGARSQVRPDGGDLFGYGAREAVVRALRGDPADRPPFGSAAPAGDLLDALGSVLGPGAGPPAPDGDQVVVPLTGAGQGAVVAALGFAHGWLVVEGSDLADSPVEVRLRPSTP
jgi:coenzyme F420-0:L-glutamate ligase/coenzyme F420-1:gamma-L-glutamate ligase